MSRSAALAAGALLGASLALAAASDASHVRPRGATPLRVPLVPSYLQCVSPNSTHGPPLGSPSCSPPRTATNHYLTVGTPDVNGAAANSVGSLVVRPTTEDVRFSLDVTDIRCLPAMSATVCGSPNSADGPDYSGNMLLSERSRFSDHNNGPGHDEAATLTDIPFPMDVNCANTASPAVGSECTTNTTANAVVAGTIQAGKRIVWEFDKFEVFDAGSDGDIHRGEGAVTRFLAQGVFAP